MVVSTFNVHGSPTEFLPCSLLSLLQNTFYFPGFVWNNQILNMQLRKWRVKKNWSYEVINLYHHHQLAFGQLIRDCLLIYQIVMTRPGVTNSVWSQMGIGVPYPHIPY